MNTNSLYHKPVLLTIFPLLLYTCVERKYEGYTQLACGNQSPANLAMADNPENEVEVPPDASVRFPAQLKREAIRRVLSGEDLDEVATQLSIPSSELEDWIGKFLLARAGQTKTVPWEQKRKRRFRQYRDKTRSELDYPEMFREIPRRYLRRLKPERAKEIVVKQAKAQEKVGYERSTKKFFLPVEEDPFPEDRIEEPEPWMRIDFTRAALFSGGLLLGLAIYAAVVALGIPVGKLGWMPAVLLGVLALAILASLLKPE